VAKEKVVSAIDGTSHEIKIPSNEPQALVSFKKGGTRRYI
jgi:hypothetical protein